MDIKVLEKELQYFAQIKSDLLKANTGQFALIKGQKLIGTFTTFQEAYEAGIAQFQNTPFLVKQVLEKESLESLPALTYSLLRANL